MKVLFLLKVMYASSPSLFMALNMLQDNGLSDLLKSLNLKVFINPRMIIIFLSNKILQI